MEAIVKAILGVLALVLSVTWTCVGAAQAEPAGYRELVASALEERAANNHEEARSLFRRAHALFPNARTLRGIGMEEFDLRNYGECIALLEQALTSQVRPLDATLRAETETTLASARNFVARINLELQPGAATVLVDGVPVTLGAGNTLVLRVGDHVLEFKAEGRVPQRHQLRVDGGEQRTINVTLSEQPVAASIVPTPPPAGAPTTAPTATPITAPFRITTATTSVTTTTTPATAPTQHAEQSASPLPWIIAGVSGAVLVGGVVLVAMAQSDINKVEDADKGVMWNELEGAYDNAPVKSGIGIALIGVGLAGIATGVVLGVMGGGDDEDTQVAVGLGNVSISGSF